MLLKYKGYKFIVNLEIGNFFFDILYFKNLIIKKFYSIK